MRLGVGLLIAVGGIATAHVARDAIGERAEAAEAPYAPSPGAAPFVTLGYREVAADVLFIRVIGYFANREATAEGMAPLVESVVALDPQFHRVYEYGAIAMTATPGVTQEIYLRAIAVLERGIAEFPQDWKLPNLAGEMYALDLVTKDPVQRRAWDEKGVLLTESSLRKPNASPEAATWAATMRTRMGQHDRAVRELSELILLTTDVDARKRMIEKLATLDAGNEDELAAELYEESRRLEDERKRERPDLPTTMYILLGPRLRPGFDMTDLATGGADLVGSKPIEKLEPLY